MDQALEEHAVNLLETFYRAAGEALPTFRPVLASALPSPYRELLAHEQDMTSTLESFTGQELSLEVLQSRVENGSLYREVVLVGDGDGTPAEFGAIRIDVDRIPDAVARREVKDAIRPLGGILRLHGVEHRCRPTAFFRVDSDAVMRGVFGLTCDRPLYGRHTHLFGAGDVLMAEVTEILPPAANREA